MSTAHRADRAQTTLPIGTGVRAYHGRLSDLMRELTTELHGRQDGTWAARLLRGGALVAVQYDTTRKHEFRRVLRIAREQRPQGARAFAAWGREVETFLQHLGAGNWQPLPSEDAKGIAVRFLELYPQEIAPGRAKCFDCGSEIAFDHIWGAQLCDPCARRAGDRETEDILARRSL